MPVKDSDRVTKTDVSQEMARLFKSYAFYILGKPFSDLKNRSNGGLILILSRFVKDSRAATIYLALLALNLTPFSRCTIWSAQPSNNRQFSDSLVIASQQSFALDCGVSMQKHNSAKISSSLPY